MKCLFSLIGLCFSSLAFAQGFTPEEAVKRMQVPPGFQVKIVACEPMIRQPLSIDFDERGRMWVLQYLQYPKPNGLKAVKQDQYLRTVWDRVPEPPPKGPKGADRITICYDPDENGRYQKSKDFVSDLNLASGFCIGNGGVYVAQPPYLLFYADKNKDDVPDGDPEVCLTGFGIEDSHAFANSLQWGPDGWLYGAQGSTVTAKIINPAKPKDAPIEFQQGIWRYHPKTKQFELFSEGGGNTFGLDFDKHGQVIAGTNFGGKAMLHQMQGAYYVKGFAKHGPLHNPYAYGYFEHVPYKNFKGGHVTCGGIIYQADAYPKEYHDQYIACNLLSNALYWHKMTPKGATFEAEHGGDFLIANDTWFRPVDCFQGPDGSVYVADWYDKRANHVDPIDDWDKSNGRIYKIEYVGERRDKGDRSDKGEPNRVSGQSNPQTFDLIKKTAMELADLLRHPNKWWRNQARRLLAEKGADKATIAKLRIWATEETGVVALEALWALYGIRWFDEALAFELLNHPDDYVRAWTVRLMGEYFHDSEKIEKKLYDRCCDLAESEEASPIVLAQLAATAKYLPDPFGAELADMLATSRETSPVDPALPLMYWWAVESHQKHFSHPCTLTMQATKKPEKLFVLERFARFATFTNHREISLLVFSSYADCNHALLTGIDQGLGTSVNKETKEVLLRVLHTMDAGDSVDPLVPRLLVRLGDGPAYRTLLKQADDSKLSDAERLKKFGLLAELRKPDALPLFFDTFQHSKSEALRLGSLNAMQSYTDERVGETVLALFPTLTGKLRQQAQFALLSRQNTALTLLQLVEKGTVQSKEIAPIQLQPLLAYNDPVINKLIEKHWGKIGAATPGEKLARVGAINNYFNHNKAGDALKGKTLFTKNCAVCHTLFGEGGKVGPDLTTADRKNRTYLLTHIVDPSLYIRPEFVSYNVTLADGRKLVGMVGESTAESITLLNVVANQVQKTSIAKATIEEMLPSPVSLMPEKLLDVMKNEEIADLFAYMQAEAPAKKEIDKEPSKKLKVLLISGSLEYKSDESLALLQKHLEANYPVECSRAFRKADDDLPGLEGLETCDVAVFFTRRLNINGEQLERVKKYALSNKPIVGIRTASHGFQNWLEMDKDVFGGDYKNHYKAGPKCEIKLTENQKEHPILQGFKSYESNASLYRNKDIAKGVTVLLTGKTTENTEPIAWARERKGGNMFYTSLGHPDDFKKDSFIRLLTNAIFWTAGRELPAK